MKIIISREQIEFWNGYNHIYTPGANVGFISPEVEMVMGNVCSFFNFMNILKLFFQIALTS